MGVKRINISAQTCCGFRKLAVVKCTAGKLKWGIGSLPDSESDPYPTRMQGRVEPPLQ